ncbi:MAG: 50S ribosomal protein L17 [Crocinitomicaceae bacterium]|nr:50S ribosomal protein L17 [Crocinitomicaceae bacterium]|tara:strand:- start:664 stop:1347 length:684 start_codon:yes stop_codon:yes gene_type:complete
MRHGKKNNHLSRKKAHRDALLSNMACSLIEHKRINTTLAKAKALRVYVEPLLTKSKTDTTHSRRVVFSYLQNKEAASTLFRDVAPKISDRPGGYTRIIKLNNRLGDNAQMAMIELVDFNELLLTEKAPKKKSTRRRGGKSKSKSPQAEAAVEASAEIEEAVVVEESTSEDVQQTAEDVVTQPAAEAKTEVEDSNTVVEETSDDTQVEKKEDQATNEESSSEEDDKKE